MADKTAFDILFDKLSERGMNPVKHVSERSFIVPGKDRFLNAKFIVASYNSLFYFSSDSYGTAAYSSKTFTGIFGAINLPPETDCHIYKKDWVDLIFRRHKRKTGIKFIDENLTITSVTDWIPSLLLQETDINLYLEINKRINPLKIIIEYDYLSMIPDLKGKAIVGIETDLWLTEDNDLDTIILLGGRVIEDIINTCALTQAHTI